MNIIKRGFGLASRLITRGFKQAEKIVTPFSSDEVKSKILTTVSVRSKINGNPDFAAGITGIESVKSKINESIISLESRI